MPTATRTRVRSSPYATNTGESSRAANAQPTGRGIRITRSRSASVVSSNNDAEDVRPRQVTRSQTGRTPAVQRLDRVVEDELDEFTGSSAAGESDQESDLAATGGSRPVRRSRRLQMRRSIVAQYEDNDLRNNIRFGIFGRPLTLEQRALRLRHDAGAVLGAILRNEGESDSPFAMDNGAKLTSLRGESALIEENGRSANRGTAFLSCSAVNPCQREFRALSRQERPTHCTKLRPIRAFRNLEFGSSRSQYRCFRADCGCSSRGCRKPRTRG